jgi:hypothetical protein
LNQKEIQRGWFNESAGFWREIVTSGPAAEHRRNKRAAYGKRQHPGPNSACGAKALPAQAQTALQEKASLRALRRSEAAGPSNYGKLFFFAETGKEKGRKNPPLFVCNVAVCSADLIRL